MKRLTNILSFLLALLILLAMFAGCGDSQANTPLVSESDTESEAGPEAEPEAEPEVEPETEPETEPEAEPEAEPETEPEVEPEATYPFKLPYIPVTEETTITLWCSFNPQALTVVESVADTSVFKKMEEITGVALDAVSIAGNVAKDAFNILINAGEYPDIIGNLASLYKGLDAAVDDGIAIDLLPYMEEYSPNFWYLINEKPELRKYLTSDEGRIVRYTSFSMEGTITGLGNVIRQDWLDDLDLEVPRTYDEMHDVLTAFKVEKGADSGLWLDHLGLGCYNCLTNGYDIAGWYDVMSNYHPFNVIDGEVQFCWTTDNMKAYLTMMHNWYEEDLLWKDFVSDTATNNISTSNGLDKVFTDDIGIFHAEISHITSFPEQYNGEMVLRGFSDVTLKAGDTLHNFPMPVGVGQASWSISTDCDENKIPIIMNWVDYLFTPEGSELASWGIEGEACTTNADGTKQFTDLVLNNPDGYSMMVILSLYAMQSANPYLLQLDREKAVYNDEQLAAADAWIANQDGSHAYPESAFLNASESSEYSIIWADLGTYATETIPKFIIGELDLEADWKEYISTLDAMNASRLVELKQAAYDRYAAK